uniref:Uncharacterized protein n=1 Tax=Sphaerodactylus townsendi TaxID=933632 RepID=A0ACB8E6Z8_9SAUR
MLLKGQWWLGLCLSCSGEGHKVAVCPSKKPDSPVVPISGAVKAGTTKDPGKKSPFKKGTGQQVVSCQVSLASEEAGGPKSSEESAGNDRDLPEARPIPGPFEGCFILAPSLEKIHLAAISMSSNARLSKDFTLQGDLKVLYVIL